MQARLTLIAVAVAAALSLTVSAGAANNRPGDYYSKQPGTAGWTSVGIATSGWNAVQPNPFGLRTIGPHATAGWTRAST